MLAIRTSNKLAKRRVQNLKVAVEYTIMLL